jgi:hypothetical protein
MSDAKETIDTLSITARIASAFAKEINDLMLAGHGVPLGLMAEIVSSSALTMIACGSADYPEHTSSIMLAVAKSIAGVATDGTVSIKTMGGAGQC